MSGDWDCLISKFRSLGGIADNVCQQEGEFGRGIFSINPNLRSRIYTPSKLMIKKQDIYLEDNQLGIMKDKNYSKEIRDFFSYYQDTFYWGGGGKETTESFEKGLFCFSSDLKKLIKKYILVDLEERHKGDWKKIIKDQFLNARKVEFAKKSVIAPVWDLVNHEVISLSFITSSNGISTPNYPPMDSEITYNYNNKSSLNRFFSYGFFSKETIVFSFPFSINIKNLGINLRCKGKELNNDFIKIERSYDEVIIEGLPIADVNNSRLPIEYFDELSRRISEISISKNILSEIIQFNILNRKKIKKESESKDNEVSNIFTEILNYEINLISSYD
tara:strand:+ start:1912 stop:2907 length:996 start_codon:yes stop_codon:yes gene_type:complete